MKRVLCEIQIVRKEVILTQLAGYEPGTCERIDGRTYHVTYKFRYRLKGGKLDDWFEYSTDVWQEGIRHVLRETLSNRVYEEIMEAHDKNRRKRKNRKEAIKFAENGYTITRIRI